MKALIYTKDNCGYCVKAKTLMEQKGIAYEEVSAVDHKDDLVSMVLAETGFPPKTVPQIFIDGKYVGGHDALVNWISNAL